MHPIERLRSVARAGDVSTRLLVGEAASGLASVSRDHQTLVMASRRMLGDHPGVGALVWLAARMLTALEPSREAWAAAEELDGDQTALVLGRALPEGARAVFLADADLLLRALGRRADVEPRVVGGGRAASGLLRVGCDVVEVGHAGVGAATADADLVVVEAGAVGDDAAVVPLGAYPLAAAARLRGVPVWLVAGVGSVLPRPMWNGLLGRLDGGDPWDRTFEVLSLDMVDEVVRPTGVESVASALQAADCPIAHELT